MKLKLTLLFLLAGISSSVFPAAPAEAPAAKPVSPVATAQTVSAVGDKKLKKKKPDAGLDNPSQRAPLRVDAAAANAAHPAEFKAAAEDRNSPRDRSRNQTTAEVNALKEAARAVIKHSSPAIAMATVTDVVSEYDFRAPARASMAALEQIMTQGGLGRIGTYSLSRPATDQHEAKINSEDEATKQRAHALKVFKAISEIPYFEPNASGATDGSTTQILGAELTELEKVVFNKLRDDGVVVLARSQDKAKDENSTVAERRRGTAPKSKTAKKSSNSKALLWTGIGIGAAATIASISFGAFFVHPYVKSRQANQASR